MSDKNNTVDTTSTVADLVFSGWRSQPKRVGAPAYYLAKISRKLHENEEN